MSFLGKTPPPSDPDRDLGGQPTPTPRRPDPPTEAKVECHPRTLECQTLKMREPVHVGGSSLTSQGFVVSK